MLEKSLKDSWVFFKNHYRKFSIIILPFVIPIEIFAGSYSAFFTGDDYAIAEQLPLMVVYFSVDAFYSIAIIFYVASVISGKALGARQVWSLAVMNWPRYMVMSIVAGAAVLCGLALLIVPGIILSVRFIFSGFFLLLERYSPIAAINRSWDATKVYQHMWTLLLGLLIITACIMAPYIVLQILVDASATAYRVLDVIISIVIDLFSTLYIIFTYRVFCLLREHAVSSRQAATP